eukprot:TRINITY_DN884_c0_g1_i1.p1 TRINITY_DN884_c0_g1~~TRINITY_DN884_c0_g1_i1.p1  ORF type:complete len:542 (-),score=88.74 TRINITY_DN884_c0_g1_i1:28-1563(-)
MKVGVVCKTWKNWSRDSGLWRNYLIRDFPEHISSPPKYKKRADEQEILKSVKKPADVSFVHEKLVGVYEKKAPFEQYVMRTTWDRYASQILLTCSWKELQDNPNITMLYDPEEDLLKGCLFECAFVWLFDPERSPELDEEFAKKFAVPGLPTCLGDNFLRHFAWILKTFLNKRWGTWTSAEQEIVSQKVFSFLQMWLEITWTDLFHDSPDSRKLLVDVCTNFAKVSKWSLHKKLQSYCDERLREVPKTKRFPPTKPDSEPISVSAAIKSLLARSKGKRLTEVAQAIVLFEQEQLHNIRLNNLLQFSPTVQSLVTNFRHFSGAVMSCIIAEPKLKQRIKIYQVFVLLANELVRLKCYNAAQAIFGGLMHCAVNRLNFTKNGISKKSRKVLAEIEKLVSATMSFKTLRDRIAEAVKERTAFVPSFSIALSDLSFIRKYNPGLFWDWSGINVTFGTLRNIITAQNRWYSFPTTPSAEVLDLIHFFYHMTPIGDDEAVPQSKILEPIRSKKKDLL